MSAGMSLPETCKAAVYDQPSEELSAVRLVEAPVAKPGPGEVVVRTEFAAINPIDTMVMSGMMRGVGWALPLPFTMGYDIAGTVAAVGEGVADLKPGDAVFGVNWGKASHNVEPIAGTLKEFATLKASMLSLRPEGCPADKAAAVALVGTTAWQSLFDCLAVGKGQRVLILGGAGAVGQIAIQLARRAGAWVATTASPRTMAFVEKTCKPNLIINYVDQNWWEVPELEGVDAVFATTSEETPWTHSRQILKAGGRYVSIAAADVGFDPTAHSAEGYPFASFFCLSNSREVQDNLAQLIADRELDVVVDSVSPFTDKGLQEALARQTSGKSMGKNVIKF